MTDMTASSQMRRKTRRFMIVAFAVAVVAFIVIAWGGINKNLVYYWTPTDLHAAGDKAYGATIRLGGMVSKGSIRNHTGVSGLEFDVHDVSGVVHVKSSGVPCTESMPVGISTSLIGVYRLALRNSTWSSVEPLPSPARLKYAWLARLMMVSFLRTTAR